MATSIISRLCASRIPWPTHLLALAAGLYSITNPNIQIFLAVHLLATLLLDTERLLAALQDPSEPPLIPHPYLPFLGHTLGLFRHGASYFSLVNAQTQHPIFTLQTLGARTVCVTCPQLAAPIQRASKNTTFYGMILEVTRRLVAFDDAAMDIIRWNLDGEMGSGEGLMREAHDMIGAMLAPGPMLNQLSTTQLDIFARMLNENVVSPRGAPGSGPGPGPGSVLETSLMDFVKGVFTRANALTIYGPQNPFERHPELVQKFWDYEAGMIQVMADIAPWITARKAWAAREAINAALHEFIEKEHYRSASPLIQKRVAINLKHGLSKKMAGRGELILLFGIIGNAVPTTFWFLAHVFGRQGLLAEIREEMRRVVLHAKAADGTMDKTIRVGDLKTKCPLLVSAYRETLRCIANLSSVRLVRNTHTIHGGGGSGGSGGGPGHGSSYVLKKGTMIQIASGVIHASEAVWGPGAKTFDPRRFIAGTIWSEQFSAETGGDSSSNERTATALPQNVPSAAYRAFGGGSVICPGRHFAQSEILGFVALCANMFEVEDVHGGPMQVPERDDRRIPLSVMKPVVEPMVRIQRRVGEERVRWRLEL